jgi:hypothetical protein
VVLLEYSIPEAALRLGITVQRAERRYASAMDSLSEALLDSGLLRPVFQTGDEGPNGSPGNARAQRNRLRNCPDPAVTQLRQTPAGTSTARARQ